MDKELFLKELLELSKKHGIYIISGGCGCCGSTHIEDEQGEELSDLLGYEKEQGIYTAEFW